MNPENQTPIPPVQTPAPGVLPTPATPVQSPVTPVPITPAVIQTPAAPPVVPEAPGPKKKMLIILVVLLALIGLGVLGYFVFRSQTKTEVNTSPQTLPTPGGSESTNGDLEQVKEAASNHLVLEGFKLESLKVDAPVPLGIHTDKYVVGYSDTSDTSGHGGAWLIVGKINNEWVVSTDEDTYRCEWIKTAQLDEATASFMGGPACGY